jgi:hypothetical protein
MANKRPLVSYSGIRKEIADADAVYSPGGFVGPGVTDIFITETTAGVLDWNDASNTAPGVGPTLLLGTATNGPGVSAYYHVLNFEYSNTGNVTQFAIPYGIHTDGPYMRGRYGGTWTSWVRTITSGNIASQSVAYAATAPFSGLSGLPAAMNAHGITDFRSGSSVAETTDANLALTNGVYYVASNTPSGHSFSDGGLYVQAYSANYLGQIWQNYRTGRLAVRGKSAETGGFTSWLNLVDETTAQTLTNKTLTSPIIQGSGNYPAYIQSLTGAQTHWFYTDGGGVGLANATPYTSGSMVYMHGTGVNLYNGSTVIGSFTPSAVTFSQLAAVGTGVTPGTRAFIVASNGGDRMRVYPQAAGSGVVIDVTDNGETTSARPLTLGASNGTVYLAGAGLTVTSNGITAGSGAGLSGTAASLTAGKANRVAQYLNSNGTWNEAEFTTASAAATSSVMEKVAGTGEPDGSGRWWHVVNHRHSDSTPYGVQVAYPWNGGNGEMYTRQMLNNVFGPWNRFLNNGNFNSYAPTLSGTGANGTWNIAVTGNAGSVGGMTPTSAATANTVVSRDGNADTYVRYMFTVHVNQSSGNNENPTVSQFMVTNGSDGYARKAGIAHVMGQLKLTAKQSFRDFADGTLVTTDIAVAGGDAYLLQVRGFMYGAGKPVDAQFGGYIYGGTTGYNANGLCQGKYMNGLRSFELGGVLCFWWPRYGYWNGFDVFVSTVTGAQEYKHNRVVSITNSVVPPSRTMDYLWDSATGLGLDSANFNSYAPSLTGGGASGSWNINVSGNAGTVGGRSVGQTTGQVPYFQDSNGYLVTPTWVGIGAGAGIYSANGTNSAHFLPHDGSYGTWKITGSRGGWNGLSFNTGVANQTVMMSAGQVGFYDETYSWKFYWVAGELWTCRGTYGGGTTYKVVDAGNFHDYRVESATASTVMGRDAGGYAYATYFNQSSGASEGGTVAQFMINNGADNFMRKASIAQVRTALYSAQADFAAGVTAASSLQVGNGASTSASRESYAYVNTGYAAAHTNNVHGQDVASFITNMSGAPIGGVPHGNNGVYSFNYPIYIAPGSVASAVFSTSSFTSLLNIHGAGSYKPLGAPSANWNTDATTSLASVPGSGGTYALPAGSGLVLLHDNATGHFGIYHTAAGGVYKVRCIGIFHDADVTGWNATMPAGYVGMHYSDVTGSYRIVNNVDSNARSIGVHHIKTRSGS